MTGGNKERGHSLFPDFNVLFDREFPGLPGWRPTTAAHSIPVEMSTDGGVRVPRAELPGVDPEDITIRVGGDVTFGGAMTAETPGPVARALVRQGKGGDFRCPERIRARAHHIGIELAATP
ncbi:Hsp20/alpha crystallin family protein [Streptomyces zaomyceticus]|uniref:Hsp20/alpha crystallin family protein n=1 Tax=Streptomyces zaomyceticus TaxID=68286 RepID=UPI003648651E